MLKIQRQEFILAMFDKYHPNPHNSSKPGTPSTVPSKTLIINWLKTMFPDLPANLKIQDFGNGVIYCRIINHFHPGSIPPTKILNNPKTQYECLNNLKQVQQSLVQLNIKLNLDVNKLSKRKFLENWSLINTMYKHFTSEENAQENSFFNSKPVGKRTYEAAFPQQFGSASKPQTMPQFSQNMNYMVPVWERNSLNLCFNSGLPQTPMKMNYFKENNGNYTGSPVKGKWSVNSHMFQNNHNAVIDRVKEILLKNSNDTEKIKQIKMLLNIPIEEEEAIKIEEEEINEVVYNSNIKERKGEGREEQGERNQSDTHPQKNPKASVSKLKKPFKV